MFVAMWKRCLAPVARNPAKPMHMHEWLGRGKIIAEKEDSVLREGTPFDAGLMVEVNDRVFDALTCRLRSL